MKAMYESEKKKITIDEISKLYKIYDYADLTKYIMENIAKGYLSPIKNSGTNGKKPALYNSYRILAISDDNNEYAEELKYKINSALNTDYYMKNLNLYPKDRADILLLSNYIDSKKELLEDMVSINERSFEIWGREKFIQKGGAKRILKNLDFDIEKLNMYETAEPLAYYSHYKDSPQHILILENKDTFYSMRRHLLKGNKSILGTSFGTLIYGGGKSINKSFDDFTFHAEPYLNNSRNTIMYFGDLDYEGIVIYESLRERLAGKFEIVPFKNAYISMLDKSNNISLPYTKKGQNRNIGHSFIDTFNQDERAKIFDILENDKYIPQEILNIRDF